MKRRRRKTNCGTNTNAAHKQRKKSREKEHYCLWIISRSFFLGFSSAVWVWVSWYRRKDVLLFFPYWHDPSLQYSHISNVCLLHFFPWRNLCLRSTSHRPGVVRFMGTEWLLRGGRWDSLDVLISYYFDRLTATSISMPQPLAAHINCSTH